MNNILKVVMFMAILLSTLAVIAYVKTKDKSPDPGTKIPELNVRTADLIVIGGTYKFSPDLVATGNEYKFSPSEHGGIIDNVEMVSGVYNEQMHYAMYRQDINLYYMISSKAHFDNCAFDESMDYIDSIVTDVDEKIAEVAELEAGKADYNSLVSYKMKKVFYKLGQALHAIQDFYAHSNYVELMEIQPEYEDCQMVPIVRVWTTEGRTQVHELMCKGLYSGTYKWDFPKKCPGVVPTHEQLNKDSDKSAEGKIRVERWGGVNQYTVARLLAAKATADFLKFSCDRWIPLREIIKDKGIAVNVFNEERGI